MLSGELETKVKENERDGLMSGSEGERKIQERDLGKSC